MARKLMNNKSAGASGQAEMKEKIICDRCGVEMELMEVQFRYLTRDFRYKVPRCPECGQVSLTEDLVTGKMADVEAMIEEK
ncbi:MAG: DNA-binding protein [Clostridiales bacterium]|nr:DNA-binding protein [Clostridiales bacterium]MDD7034963.1 hypothetical protein [Bacillota bacterium]MDY2920276.1 DNA-binding protein [Lentihominibacter sp.]